MLQAIIKKSVIQTRFLSTSLGLLLSISACSNIQKPDKLQAANYNAQLGAKYLQAGRLALANEKLEKALKQNPKSSDVQHYYALLKQQTGDNKAATKHFEKAIKLNKKDPNLSNNYGSHLCKTGHYYEAVEQFDRATKNPFYTTPEFAYTNAGICLRKTNDTIRSESYFRKALEKNSNFGSALFQMAKLNYDLGHFAKAQAFLLRYDEQSAPTKETLELCSIVNKQLGDIEKANVCGEKYLRLFSE